MQRLCLLFLLFIDSYISIWIAPPQIAAFDFGEDPINSGDYVSMQCSVHKGDLPINIAWLHNNISIVYISGVQVTKVGQKASSIIIDSVNQEHIGTYTCLAENKAGKTEFSTTLRVNGTSLLIIDSHAFGFF